MINEHTKLRIIGLLETGQSMRTIAEELEVPYSSVLTVSKHVKEAKAKGTMAELIKADEAFLDHAGAEVKKRVAAIDETLLAEAETEITAVIDGIAGVNILDSKMQTAGMQITAKIEAMAKCATQPDTIVQLSDSLAKLYSAFFSKGAQINVQNNLVNPGNNTSRFSNFLKD